MPDVLPTINNEPAQGIQATLDTVYLWNPDVANELIEEINVLLEKLEGVSGTIKPYDELEAPIKQYTPMFYGDGLYVAKEDMDEIPATVDLSQWILVATKATDLVAGNGIVIHDGVISVTQAISEGAEAGATAVQPEDLGTAAYAAATDFATSAQGAKADTAVQPEDLGTAAYAATTDFATAAQGAKADTALQPGSSVPQYSTMPVASTSNVGEMIQYSGPDVPDTDATAVGTATSSTITSVSVDVDAFMGEANPSGAAVYDFSCEVTPITVSYRTFAGNTTFSSSVQAITDLFAAHGYDFIHSSTVNRGYFVFTSSTECNVVDYATKQEIYFSTTTEELAQYDITLNDTPSEGDTIRYVRSGGAVRWYLDGNRVTIANYGITFEGNATGGDIISVSYTPKSKGFTSGYFYKCEPKYTAEEISITQTVGSTLYSVSIDMGTFVAQEQPTGSEVVEFIAAAEIGTYSIMPWTTPNFSASIDASVFVPLCERYGWNYNFMAVGNTNGLEDGYWYFGYTSDEPYASNLTISDLADYGITVTDLDPSATYNMAVFSYTAGNTEWRKNGTPVDLSSYGISYSGTPANGDVLTVDYTAPTLEGYFWIQKDVQPGGNGDINWETEIELPSSLGIGTFYPVFTIPGGLPVGTYEFYYQAQRYGISIVSGLVTYLFRIKLTPSGSSVSVGGYVAPVINGQFGGSTTTYGGTYVVSEPTDIGYFVYKNGNDHILYLHSELFACDVNYQGQAKTRPGAFKLSAIKNLETGDEFVASGEVYTGQFIGDSVYCNVMATPIQDTTLVPNYFLTGSGFISQYNANGFNIYNVGNSQDGFGVNYLRVMLRYDQDFYDATLKTFLGDDYELTVNSATGVFANAQVGRDTQYEGHFFVKLDESIDGDVDCIVEWLGNASEMRGQSPRVEPGRVSDEYFTEFEPLAIGRLSPKYVGRVLQYTGETDSTYTNGYFYKCVRINASATATSSNPDVTVSVSVQTFAEQVSESGQYVFEYDAGTDEWYDSNSNPVDLADFGISKSGVSLSQDTITVDYVAESCEWQRTDVQPAPSGLPDQTGQSGKFLTTDGTDASWSDKPLVNSSSNEGSLAIFGSASANYAVATGNSSNAGGQNSVAIGYNTGNTNTSANECVYIGTGSKVNNASVSTIAIGYGAKSTNTSAISIGKNADASGGQSIAIGGAPNYSGYHGATASATGSIAIGSGGSSSTYGARASGMYSISVGQYSAASGSYSVAFGSGAQVTTNNTVLIGSKSDGRSYPISDANTFYYQNENGQFKIIGADGTIPSDRLAHAINKYSTMPTAAADNEGWIVQFTGTTDSTYTHGHLYECVSDGQSPATYSWEAVEVQASSGGLPDQTGNAGKFLTTDGTDASWSDKPLVNLSTSSGHKELAVGYNVVVTNDSTATGVRIGSDITGSHWSTGNVVAIGSGIALRNYASGVFIAPGPINRASGGIIISSNKNGIVGNSADRVGGIIICSGGSAQIGPNKGAFSLLLGTQGQVNADGTTFICNGSNLSGNPTQITEDDTFWWENRNDVYKLVDSDGTIPKERLVNAVSKPSTMPELTVAGWSNNTQTVTVTGVTATNTVFVSPAPASVSDYASAGIYCTAQGTDSLTFTCTTVPTNAITVNVVIMG